MPQAAPDLRAQIVAEARTWLGTPSGKDGHQQRRKGEQVDCPGPIAETCKAFDLSAFDLRDYERYPTGELMEICRREGVEISPATIQPADVILLQFGGEPMHLAMVVDYPYGGQLAMLHASRKHRKVVEHRLTPEWRARIVAAFRLPGVPED